MHFQRRMSWHRRVWWSGSCALIFAGCSSSPTLNVVKAGTGSGKVTSATAGIDCGATCTFTTSRGGNVTLTATPDAESAFVGWGDACAGSSPQCSVTMDGDRIVFAAFRTISVTLGGYHTCAILTADGRVRCWGRNTDEQVIASDGDSPNDPNAPPVLTPTSNNADAVIAVSAGAYHTCELTPKGIVRCWGLNGDGQVGIDPPVRCGNYGSCGMGRTTVPGVTNAIAIAAGGYHTCALLGDHTVRCWGRYSDGQLGSGPTPTSRAPAAVSGLSTVVAIGAGAYHTCALLADLTVRCWGLNSNGQLGDGTNNSAFTPVAVSGLTGVTAIAVGNGGGVSGAPQLGGYHSCALVSNGMIACWGHNRDGELGNGSNQDSNLPVTVAGMASATAIAAGSYHTCAVVSTAPAGHVECWGHNADGELGSASFVASNRPVRASGSFVARTIAAGGFHTCAIVSAAPPGAIWCWGHNGDGGLGNNSTTSSPTPVPVSGF